jgi:hypothetical protein
VHPDNTEATLKVNEMMQNLKTTVEPNESQTIISDHPPEGMVQNFTGWLEWYIEEKPEAAGTLN